MLALAGFSVIGRYLLDIFVISKQGAKLHLFDVRQIELWCSLLLTLFKKAMNLCH